MQVMRGRVNRSSQAPALYSSATGKTSRVSERREREAGREIGRGDL